MPRTHDATGRARKTSGDVLIAPLANTSNPYPRRRNKIAFQFVARPSEMLESPAYRVLSLSAHRVLSRIEIELGHHAGKENGRLPVTYTDFVAYGVSKHAIAPAIRELEALGFIEVTEHGRGGNAEWRIPNKFRLTYRPTSNAPYAQTDEWKLIKTVERAEQLAEAARQKTKPAPRKSTISPPEKRGENVSAPPPEKGGTVRPQKSGVHLHLGRVAGEDAPVGDGELEGAHGSEREQPDSDQDVMPLDSPPVDPPADNVVTVTAESLEARRRRLRLLGSASSVSAAAGLRSDRETA
jgi:hypothetical protein